MLDPITNQQQDRRLPAPQQRGAFGNSALDILGSREAELLAPSLRRVFLQRDQVIVRPGEPITALHFPIDAFAWSWTETTGAERPTSVLTVGRRGVVEWNRVLEADCGQTCVTVISPGAAWQLPIEVFEKHQPHRDSPLRRTLLRYANACILNATPNIISISGWLAGCSGCRMNRGIPNSRLRTIRLPRLQRLGAPRSRLRYRSFNAMVSFVHNMGGYGY
jgi:hypothetical protein